jgi:hypothetical protein
MNDNKPHTDNSSLKGTSAPDPSWNGVYKVGGVCLLLAGLAIFAVAILSIVIGPPPGGAEEYLQALARHASAAALNFGLFALADVMLLLGVLAIYLALRHIAKNAMLIATALLVLFVVLDLAITELNSLTLVALTQHYAAATTETQRAAYVAAADYALATLPIGTFLSYFVSSVGLLIASIVMLRGVFSRPTALAGIVASVAGILGGFYLIFPPLALLLTPSLIAFGLWALLAGVRLYKLGRLQPAAL